jgi:hypothetical protein
MKRELFLGMISVVAAFWPPLTLPVCRPRHQVKTPAISASLQLTTSIIQQDFCEDGGLRVWLRLRYTNIGGEPIILRRYSDSFMRYTISRDREAAAKEHHEEVVQITSIVSQPNATHGRTPPNERFVILNSGESYEIDTKVGGGDFIFLNSSSVRRFRKGNHVLQVWVSTWNEPVVLAEELSVAWRKYGILWWQGVTSLPMPFKIENPTRTIKCS